MRKATNIEVIMNKLLLNIKVNFKREYKIGNYPVDFYLPKYKLSIQVDGCFHHYCQECCLKQVKIYPRQIFQKYKDLACNMYHSYKKINLIRFYECSILKDIDKVEKEVLNAIKQIKTGNNVLP